jgi:predicted signal transduction protein with EAL and GGDEF domain
MIGARLTAMIREQDMLARIGGDEFAILQTRVVNSEDAAEFARRILTAIESCSGFEGSTLRACASVGIAMHPHDGVNPEDLLKNADFAMYRAKAEKGNSFCFYAADAHARARRDIVLDTELRQAIAENQFVLFYQPQIDIETGDIVGAEALLRWKRPGAGIVAPGVFLGRAEENGLIIPINEWVLREACREARTWRNCSDTPFCVSVNMSPIQFEKQNVPLLVAKTLAESGLDPRRLDLEITEGIVLKDFDEVAQDLRKLLEMGVKISIDDFGTGYSSLSYAKRLPVSRLKIDQSFVRNLHSNSHDAAIVRAIVTLGHSLDLTVLAEGVETVEQLESLRAEGCDEAQGYFFGRPMPAENFRKLISEPSTKGRSLKRAAS